MKEFVMSKDECYRKRYRDVYMECNVYNTRHHKIHDSRKDYKRKPKHLKKFLDEQNYNDGE